MSKIFSFIKGWILLQMSNLKSWSLSLFTKDKQEELQEPPTVIESEDIHFDLQEKSINQITAISKIEDKEVDESLIPSKLVDTSSSIQTVEAPQELLDQDYEVAEPILQEEAPPFLYDGKYDQYFNTPYTPIPMSYVNEEIWNIITTQLREDYVIPLNTSHSLYQNN